MTERLYYHDSYLKEFEAGVVSAERAVGAAAAGERWNVVLDRTAFYPTSGGQPHDLGTLGGGRVLEVMDGDDGNIVHVVEGNVTKGWLADGPSTER